MVSPRFLIGLLLACVVAFGGGMAAWVLVQPGADTEVPAAAPASDAERSAQRERFFGGGDPDRDVRGGQEMKPRW